MPCGSCARARERERRRQAHYRRERPRAPAGRCGVEAGLADVNGLERVWRHEVNRVHALFAHWGPSAQDRARAAAAALRYLPTYTDIQCAVHFDVAESVLPQPYREFAFKLLQVTNDCFQLRTADYAYWSGLTSAQMQAQYGLPAQVADATLAFIQQNTVAGTPRVRFVLNTVQTRPDTQSLGLTVNVNSRNQVVDLKQARLPAIPGVFNIWVADLTDGVLGVATFPFQRVQDPEFGVLVDYRSTDPAVSSVDRLQFADNRTMVHEIGHCMGLFHTFTDPTRPLTDAGGGRLDDPLDNGQPLEEYKYGDGSALTPQQLEPTRGNPLTSYQTASSVFNSANQVVFFPNFMDYTDDPAMLCLALDQVGRFEYFFQNNVRGVQVTSVVDTGQTSYDALPAPPPASAARLVVLDSRVDGYVPGQFQEGGGGGGGGTLSTMQIVAIAVGAALALALILGLAIGLSVRAKKKREAAAAPAAAPPSTSGAAGTVKT